MKKIYTCLLIAGALEWGCAQNRKAVTVPRTLDSLEVFLKTRPVDTAYVQAMNDCAFLYILNSQYTRADSLVGRLKELPPKLDPVKVPYYVSVLEGTLAFQQGNKSASLRNYLNALAVIEKQPERFRPQMWHNALSNAASAYGRFGNIDSSIHYSLRAIKVQERYGFTNQAPYVAVGTALRKIGKQAQALPYYRKALALVTEKKDLRSMAVIESLLGTTLDEMGRLREALPYYLSGLPHARQADYAALEIDLLNNLGLVHAKLKQPAKALEYLKEGEKLCRKLNVDEGLVTNLQNQGNTYRELKNHALAEQHYLEALALAKKTNGYDGVHTSNRALAEVYMDTGQYAKACTFLQAAAVAKDSSAAQMAAQKTEELILKYEDEKKQQEIQLLHEQTAAQNLKIGIQRRNLLLLLATGFGLAAVGFTAYRRYRLRQLLEMEKIRTRIAADFHDEIGANLSGIAMYSEILLRQAARQGSADTNGGTEMLENIGRNSRDTISSINDLIWTVKPDNDLLERTMVRMKEFAIPLLEAKDITFGFDFPDSLRHLELEMNTRKFVYLIFKEAINNLLKYADATRVEVVLKQENRQISLRIADNGQGFDTATAKRGNGLGNMAKRAAEMNGQLFVDSRPGRGTTVLLTFAAN